MRLDVRVILILLLLSCRRVEQSDGFLDAPNVIRNSRLDCLGSMSAPNAAGRRAGCRRLIPDDGQSQVARIRSTMTFNDGAAESGPFASGRHREPPSGLGGTFRIVSRHQPGFGRRQPNREDTREIALLARRTGPDSVVGGISRVPQQSAVDRRRVGRFRSRVARVTNTPRTSAIGASVGRYGRSSRNVLVRFLEDNQAARGGRTIQSPRSVIP